MDCRTPGFSVYHQLPELAQTPVHRVDDVIQQFHPLSSPSPPALIFPSESVLHVRWPKDWSFSFSISPSNEYSGLISFRVDWFDLLAVQGTLKSSSAPAQCHTAMKPQRWDLNPDALALLLHFESHAGTW